MNKISLIAAAGLVAVTVSSAHANLINWDTVGNLGTETSEPSTANASGVGPSSLSLGAGVTAAGNGNRFGGSGWWNTGNTALGSTLAEAVTGNDFIEFTATPDAGFTVTAEAFTFVWDRSSTGPSSVTLRSSADSFVGDLGSVTGLVQAGVATTTLQTINFADFSFTIPTTFRLYGFGGTATGGTAGFDTVAAGALGQITPNVTLVGTAIPEPTTLGLIAAGSLVMLRRRK